MNPSPKKGVRVRLAPSPTGLMHVGLARTGLFNWLFARQNKGEFLLRVEDTDLERSRKEYEEDIVAGLKWLGLNWDGDIYRQSERTSTYREYLDKLLKEGKAYYCYCTKDELEAQRQAMITAGLSPKYNGHCRNIARPPSEKKPQVIRFITPEAEVEFKDLIRGKVKFDARLLGDIVIAKDLDTPLYNLAVVVDDGLMGITHVIRGEDHISNTPKQLLLQEALGFEAPIYAHIPLILAPDRSKLSKRKSETSLMSYKTRGYLPEAMVNFLALLGWHTEGNEEIFSLDELVKLFDIGRVLKSGAVFSEEKLNWINNQYLRKLGENEIFDLLQPYLNERNISAPRDFVLKIIEVEKERMRTLEDFFIESDFFFELPGYEVSLLKWRTQTLPDVQIELSKISEVFRSVSDDVFNRSTLEASLAELVRGASRGEVFWPLRAALSGKSASPDPLVIAEILGKNEVLERISLAIKKITEG